MNSPQQNTKARFITLEGIDGAGKSTHLSWIAEQLRVRCPEVVVTREPGGTPLGEKLREVLLKQTMHPETETLIMFAARREHLDKVILPALARGAWVIADRFSDATFAYQGGGRGVSPDKLEVLERWIQQGLQPDLTLLFDVPVVIAKKRLSGNARFDRFEREQEVFFENVRSAYLERAARYPRRFRVIDATQSVEQVKKQLQQIITSYCL
ncbi:MAG TPA: dTMP kinase [Burkholderiales bacterium]|nr:dTMP kinase [Burkholderiales bacterium]